MTIAVTIVVQLALAVALVLQQGSAAPAAQRAGDKVWIGRYAEFEDYLRSAAIDRYEDTKVGVTRPRHAFFKPGGPAAGATVKYLPPGKRNGFYESYKSEIAAYKLDRLLQLDMVPPTVEREIDGNLVSVQLWVENARTIKEIQQKKLSSPNLEAWNRDVFRQRVFDDLVANIDENGGNLLIDSGWNMIKVDHSRCFATMKMPFELTRIDRPLYGRLQALDEATVTREIGDLLEPGAVSALLSRRDDIVKTFQKLIAKQGEARVLLP
jgi:hypothetical protein